jgi:hypothetical protein
MIQIHQPEVEALIQQSPHSGRIRQHQQVLLQALQDASLPVAPTSASPSGPSGLDIVAVFRRSPRKEVDIFPESYVLPISDPVEF